MNLFYGVVGGNDATVKFTDSHGDTTTVMLFGTDSIRDYNNNLNHNYSNALSGSDPGVTAVNFWNNCANPAACNSSLNYQRLDAQTFALPASWAGYNLTSITITDPQAGSQVNDIVLSALQLSVDSAVTSPEPATLSLLLAGLFGAGIARRRRLI